MSSPKEADRVKASAAAFSSGLNCAQAIATAFQDVYNIPQATIDAHKRSGKGRAPGGACGALYAVLELIEDAAQRDVLAARFSEIAGDTLCRAIRREKRISCGGCVEAAAVLLQEIVTANNCTKPPSGGGHANGAE